MQFGKGIVRDCFISQYHNNYFYNAVFAGNKHLSKPIDKLKKSSKRSKYSHFYRFLDAPYPQFFLNTHQSKALGELDVFENNRLLSTINYPYRTHNLYATIYYPKYTLMGLGTVKIFLDFTKKVNQILKLIFPLVVF